MTFCLQQEKCNFKVSLLVNEHVYNCVKMPLNICIMLSLYYIHIYHTLVHNIFLPMVLLVYM